MPDKKQQFIAAVSPSDKLEEDAWEYYYANQCKSGVPASPELISYIRTIVVQEREKKKG